MNSERGQGPVDHRATSEPAVRFLVGNAAAPVLEAIAAAAERDPEVRAVERRFRQGQIEHLIIETTRARAARLRDENPHLVVEADERLTPA